MSHCGPWASVFFIVSTISFTLITQKAHRTLLKMQMLVFCVLRWWKKYPEETTDLRQASTTMYHYSRYSLTLISNLGLEKRPQWPVLFRPFIFDIQRETLCSSILSMLDELSFSILSVYSCAQLWPTHRPFLCVRFFFLFNYKLVIESLVLYCKKSFLVLWHEREWASRYSPTISVFSRTFKTE